MWTVIGSIVSGYVSVYYYTHNIYSQNSNSTFDYILICKLKFNIVIFPVLNVSTDHRKMCSEI